MREERRTITSSAAEAQPFYVNSPYGIALAHNGNLINSKELKEKCKKAHRHVNTQSDSEILLNIFAWKISKIQNDVPTADDIFDAVAGVYDVDNIKRNVCSRGG